MMSKTLGKYQIIEEVGRGAMGVVYRGIDPVIKRPVALKTIKKELIESYGDKNLLERLKQEAQAAGRLQHPHIVVVYDYGEDDDTAYIAMSFVEGRPLREYFDKGECFSLHSSIDLMSQLLSALSYAHEHGIVHRDIKPSNIILKPNRHIMLTDFGIARLESSELTQAGAALGTPNYMSPEQCKGEPIDGRTDIFAAGVILYQFLTGKKPFEGASIASILHNIVNTAPIPPSQVKKNIPAVFDNIIEKSLAKNPEDRFATAPDFGQALKNVVLLADVKGVHDASGQDGNIQKDSKPKISGEFNSRQPDEKTAVLPPSATDDPTRVLKASAQKPDFPKHENSLAQVQHGIPANRVIKIMLFGVAALIAIVAATLYLQPAPQLPIPEGSAVSSSPESKEQSQQAKIENESVPDQSLPLREQTAIILEPQNTNQPQNDDKMESIQNAAVEKITMQDKSYLDPAGEQPSPVENVVEEDLSPQTTGAEDTAKDPSVSLKGLSPELSASSNIINESTIEKPSLSAVEEDMTDEIISMEPAHTVDVEKQPIGGNGDSKPADEQPSSMENVVEEDLSPQSTGAEDTAKDPSVSLKGLSPELSASSNIINESTIEKPSLSAVEEEKSDDISLGKVDVPPPAVSLTGTVLIQSDPVGALIYLDNEEVGVTPLEIKLVSPGVHNIKLVKNGFVAKEKSFELLPDGEKKLKITLVNNDWLQLRKKEKECAGREKILGLCK